MTEQDRREKPGTAELAASRGPVIVHTFGDSGVYDCAPWQPGARLVAPSELAERDVVLVRWIEDREGVKQS